MLGPVKNAVAIEAKIKNLNLDGYARGLNTDDLAHAFNRHGADPKPITKEALGSYYRWASSTPVLLATPASKSGKTARVTYEVFEAGNRYLVTESINPRAKLITLKSMRITN